MYLAADASRVQGSRGLSLKLEYPANKLTLTADERKKPPRVPNVRARL